MKLIEKVAAGALKKVVGKAAEKSKSVHYGRAQKVRELMQKKILSI